LRTVQRSSFGRIFLQGRVALVLRNADGLVLLREDDVDGLADDLLARVAEGALRTGADPGDEALRIEEQEPVLGRLPREHLEHGGNARLGGRG
jgi:hypothetical protein